LFIFVRPFWASSPTFLSSAIFFEWSLNQVLRTRM
jgi:hypothetical protein